MSLLNVLFSVIGKLANRSDVTLVLMNWLAAAATQPMYNSISIKNVNKSSQSSWFLDLIHG